MALVLAPQRGDTLASFCRLAGQAGLLVDQRRQYDAQVWDMHLKVTIAVVLCFLPTSEKRKKIIK